MHILYSVVFTPLRSSHHFVVLPLSWELGKEMRLVDMHLYISILSVFMSTCISTELLIRIHGTCFYFVFGWILSLFNTCLVFS